MGALHSYSCFPDFLDVSSRYVLVCGFQVLPGLKFDKLIKPLSTSAQRAAIFAHHRHCHPWLSSLTTILRAKMVSNDLSDNSSKMTSESSYDSTVNSSIILRPFSSSTRVIVRETGLRTWRWMLFVSDAVVEMGFTL